MFLCLLSDIFLVLLGISRRLLDVRHFFLYRSVLVYNPFLFKTVKRGNKTAQRAAFSHVYSVLLILGMYPSILTLPE